MIVESVVLEERCAKCGAAARAHYAQRCRNGTLSWSASIRCAACGDGIEVDGAVELPEHFRRALLSEGGRWRLVLLHVVERKHELVLALAKARRLGTKEALDLVNAKPSHLGEGTSVEMRCLETQLSGFGAQLRVERVEGAASHGAGRSAS